MVVENLILEACSWWWQTLHWDFLLLVTDPPGDVVRGNQNYANEILLVMSYSLLTECQQICYHAIYNF